MSLWALKLAYQKSQLSRFMVKQIHMNTKPVVLASLGDKIFQYNHLRHCCNSYYISHIFWKPKFFKVYDRNETICGISMKSIRSKIQYIFFKVWYQKIFWCQYGHSWHVRDFFLFVVFIAFVCSNMLSDFSWFIYKFPYFYSEFDVIIPSENWRFNVKIFNTTLHCFSVLMNI